MLQFVEQYTKSYQEDSALENEEKSKETLKENEIWVANRTNKDQEHAWNDYYNSANYDKELKEAIIESIENIEQEELEWFLLLKKNYKINRYNKVIYENNKCRKK